MQMPGGSAYCRHHFADFERFADPFIHCFNHLIGHATRDSTDENYCRIWAFCADLLQIGANAQWSGPGPLKKSHK